MKHHEFWRGVTGGVVIAKAIISDDVLAQLFFFAVFLLIAGGTYKGWYRG